MQQFTNKTITALVAAFFVVLVGVIGVQSWKNVQTAPEISSTQNQPTNNQPQSKPLAENVGQADTKNWKTYRNEKYGFEIKYPTSWYKNFESEMLMFENGPWEFASFPQTAYSHGGIRPPLGMTVVIAKGICNKSSDTWQRQEYIAKFVDMEKIVCRDGFQISLSLDGNDPKIVEHEQLLEIIANTFKFISK